MQAHDLTEARELLAHAAELLRRANASATAVQSLVVLPMIGAAAGLARDVENLQRALRNDAPPADECGPADALPHGFSTRAGSL